MNRNKKNWGFYKLGMFLLLFCSSSLSAGGGGDAAIGGLAGGMLGGIMGSAMTSSSRKETPAPAQVVSVDSSASHNIGILDERTRELIRRMDALDARLDALERRVEQMGNSASTAQDGENIAETASE